MLAADLAEIYGYTTNAFNQQVKNNIEKFDEDFRFQLTRVMKLFEVTICDLKDGGTNGKEGTGAGKRYDSCFNGN